MTLLVVSGSSVEDEPQTTPGASSGIREAPQQGGTKRSGKKVYVVKPGDTLSSIAVKTDISVAELQALNPDVDPQALASGERLKLR